MAVCAVAGLAQTFIALGVGLEIHNSSLRSCGSRCTKSADAVKWVVNNTEQKDCPFFLSRNRGGKVYVELRQMEEHRCSW